MIIVSGEFEFNTGHEAALHAAMADMMAETHKEEGCIHYQFYRRIDAPEKYHVYEEWETAAHLEAHSNSSHMGVFRTRLAEIGVISRNVKKMEAGPELSI